MRADGGPCSSGLAPEPSERQRRALVVVAELAAASDRLRPLAWFASDAVIAGGLRRCPNADAARPASAAVADGGLDGGEGAAACLRQRPPRWQAIAHLLRRPQPVIVRTRSGA